MELGADDINIDYHTSDDYDNTSDSGADQINIGIPDDDIEHFIPDDEFNEFLPVCDSKLKPFIGQQFDSLILAITFYEEYAKKCGFDSRLSSDRKDKGGTILQKKVVCNREGYNKEEDIAIRKRRRMIKRCNCPAKIVFKFRSINGVTSYVTSVFDETRNHPFVSEDGKQFMKSYRKMGSSQMAFCLNAKKVNVGAVRSHTLMKEMTGGYINVGCTAIDFKNTSRDVKKYVGDNDGEMIVRKFINMKKACDGFCFEYDTDKESRLNLLFWADPISIRNFELSGDACSVDATFRSNSYFNRYQMKFVPFTGLDNHHKIVTFGAALIAKEDIPSYKWIMKAFVKAMGREPNYIISDQDAALRYAIPDVFTTAKHRLCAWHIMKKVPDKVHIRTGKYPEFAKKLGELIYSHHLTPVVFEEKWHDLISEYDLGHVEWLSDIFNHRDQWTCAYYRNVPFGGLMRTTSISESVNSFFNQFYVSGDTIIEFYSRFESAMDKQRNTNAQLNHEDLTAKPSGRTFMPPIEKHAAKVYTRKIFYDVQIQIELSMCRVLVRSLQEVDGVKHYVLQDSKKDMSEEDVYQVKHVTANNEVICSCRMFMRRGILCRHIFFVLSQGQINEIPPQYICRRWRKNVEDMASDTIKNHVTTTYRALVEKTNHNHTEIWHDFQSCLNSAGFNMEKIERMKNILSDLKAEFNADCEVSNKFNKHAVIENLVGPQIPNELGIKNPALSTFKGCGKRFKSHGEVTHVKKARKCAVCNKFAGHNSRTCPDRVK